MASKNMNNAIKDHMVHQQRPLYLQPQRQDKTYPWMDSGGGGGDGGEGASEPSEAMDISMDAAATANPSITAATNVRGRTSKRRASSAISVEVPNTDIDPTADASSLTSIHTKGKSKRN
jgi:hypothetical protein